MKKRFLLVVALLLVGGLFLAACKPSKPAEETFALTLPEGVVSNQKDNAKVVKDTNVVITITVPSGKELDSLKVDGAEKKGDVVSNKLSFKMTKDITVTVAFKDVSADVFYSLTLPEGVTSNQSDNTKIKENTDVILTVSVPSDKEIDVFTVDGVDKKADLVDNKITVKMTKNMVVALTLKDKPAEDVFYALTLPEGVASDQEDNTKILADTEVELTITVPEGKKVATFMVDGVDKLEDIVDNKLKVTMTKDIEVAITFEDLNPELTGTLYHWMPGAIADTTGLTADINLFGATYDDVTGDGLVVKINDKVLQFVIDFDIENETISVVGQALQDAELELGEHTLSVTSAYGSGSMPFHVVDNPIDTSIPTKIIKGYNMGVVENVEITAPIALAPDLLITEINVDLGTYEHIEIFNNTNAPYNLKGHRVVFADLAKQNTEYGGIFQEPHAMRSAIYIDEEMIIPALSPAVLWIVNGRPWNVETTGTPRKVVETDNAKSLLFEGEQGGDLSIDKFKARFSIPETMPVFPLRPHYMLARTDNGWNYDVGVGLTMAKSDNWAGNSGMDNRGVQIQKISDEKFPISELPAEANPAIPAGATQYSYEFKIFNKPEEVYVGGSIDHSKMIHNGARESVNSLALRMRFWDSSDNDLGLPLVANTNTGFDIYNANFASYLTFVQKAVTPVVTAIFYQNIDDGAYAATGKRWDTNMSMQYTVPDHAAPGYFNTLMRYVVTQETYAYSDWYLETDALKPMKLMGVSDVHAPEIHNTADIEVPVDSGYPLTYLGITENTMGRIGWYNLYTTKPE